MIEVHHPEAGIILFPDDFSHDQIKDVLKRKFPAQVEPTRAGTGTPLQVQIGGNSQRDLQGTDVNAEAIVDEQQPERWDANLPQVNLPQFKSGQVDEPSDVQDVDLAPATDVRPRLSAFAPTATPEVKQVGGLPSKKWSDINYFDASSDGPLSQALQDLQKRTNHPQVQKDLALFRNSFEGRDDTFTMRPDPNADASLRNDDLDRISLEEAKGRLFHLLKDKNTYDLVFGLVGTGLGMAAGPAGMVALGAGGVMFGDQFHQLMMKTFSPETVADEPRNQGDLQNRLALNAQELARKGTEDVAYQMIVPGAGAALKTTVKGGKHVLGVTEDAGRKIRDATEKAADVVKNKVDLGVLQASDKAWLRTAAGLMQVFPVIGKHIQDSAVTTRRQFGQVTDDFLATIAPWRNVYAASKYIAKAGQKQLKAFKEKSGEKYQLFFALDDELGNPAIMRTKAMSEYAEGLTEEALEKSIPGIDAKHSKRLFNYIQTWTSVDENGVKNMPELLTWKQMRGFEHDLQAFYDKLSVEADGFEMFKRLKAILETAKADMDVSGLKPGKGEELKELIIDANEFWSNGWDRFKDPGSVGKTITGKALKDVMDDLGNVFTFGGPPTPDKLNELRKVVGDKAYKVTLRTYLEEAIESAVTTTKISGEPPVRSLDADKLREVLGLVEGDKNGRVLLKSALRGTGVKIKTLEDILALGDKVATIKISDANQFVIRRAVFAGMGLSAFTLGADFTLYGTVLAGLVLRGGGKYLTNPANLKMLTRLMDPKTSNAARDQLLTRIVRSVLDDSLPELSLEEGPLLRSPSETSTRGDKKKFRESQSRSGGVSRSRDMQRPFDVIEEAVPGTGVNPRDMQRPFDQP